ncbi:MAG: helix-turn-helix domain-containing protein [Phycisphaerae bacterium]|nr:helix-turn-helix domain-containing protein [Phycisphaerae bacterium]
MAQTGKNIRETLIIDSECNEMFMPISSPKLNFLREHGICFSGTSILRKGYEVSRKTNNAHLVLYTISGQGWLETDGYEGVLGPGQVWISADGMPQSYKLHGQEWQILWFDLQNQAPWTVIGELGTCVRQSVQGIRFKQIMDMLMWEFQTEGLHADRMIQLCSEIILGYLEREFVLEYDPSSYSIANRLHHLFFDTVKSRIKHPWTVNELSEKSELYVCPDHFSRLCIQHLNISPMKMVNQLRMERAMELLHGTDYRIQEIALLVGYQNNFAFSTAFKRWTGKSPRAFRNNLLK